jgi:hypothetical protein
MSGIDKAVKVALTVSRGKRAPYIVQPLADAPPAPLSELTPQEERASVMFTLLKESGYTDKDSMLGFVSRVTGRTVKSSSDLTDDELAAVITELEVEKSAP